MSCRGSFLQSSGIMSQKGKRRKMLSVCTCCVPRTGSTSLLPKRRFLPGLDPDQSCHLSLILSLPVLLSPQVACRVSRQDSPPSLSVLSSGLTCCGYLVCICDLVSAQWYVNSRFRRFLGAVSQSHLTEIALQSVVAIG